MTTLRHSVHVAAPPDAVWQAVAGDLLAVGRYNPMVSAVRLLGEPREGVGAARRCELTPSGFVQERVWRWEPGRAIGLEVTASSWPLASMRWVTELAADGAGTRVSQQTDYRVAFGPLGALLDALVLRRRLDRGIRAVFDGLRRHVEGAGR